MQFKHALVTGASSGIGRAVARLLAREGVQLTLCGRNVEQLAALTAELAATGVTVALLTSDLSTAEGRQIVTARIARDCPDLVINNAGSGMYGEVTTLPLQAQLDLLALNATAVFELTAAAAQALQMAQKAGTILNVSSVAAFPPFPGLAAYAASKAFVNQLSLSMDYELKAQGIRVLVACPGVVITAFRERAGGVAKEDPAAMTAEYAAEQLWWQIQQGRALYTFNWRYRLMAFMANYLLPREWTARILQRSMSKLRAPSAS